LPVADCTGVIGKPAKVAKVGAEVGAGVGAEVGAGVGAGVGAEVGAGVGAEVGAGVGGVGAVVAGNCIP